MKRLFTLFIAVLVLVFAMQIKGSSSPVLAKDEENSGRVIYVDAGANGSGADGSQDNPFLTINEAVAVAGEDTTILVAPGVYVEEQIILDVDELRLLALESEPNEGGFLTSFTNPTEIRTVTPLSFSRGAIEIQANDVEVVGFVIHAPPAIDSRATGIRIGESEGPGIEGFYIHNNLFEGTFQAAIATFRASGVIDRNTSLDPGGLGAYISGSDLDDEGPAEVILTWNDFSFKDIAAICFQFSVNDFDLFEPPVNVGEGSVEGVTANNRLHDSRAGITVVYHSTPNVSDPTKESFFEGVFEENEITDNDYGLWVSAGLTFTVGGKVEMVFSDNNVHNNLLGDALYGFSGFNDVPEACVEGGSQFPCSYAPDSSIEIKDEACDFAVIDILNDGGSSTVTLNGHNLAGIQNDVTCLLN